MARVELRLLRPVAREAQAREAAAERQRRANVRALKSPWRLLVPAGDTFAYTPAAMARATGLNIDGRHGKLLRFAARQNATSRRRLIAAMAADAARVSPGTFRTLRRRAISARALSTAEGRQRVRRAMRAAVRPRRSAPSWAAMNAAMATGRAAQREKLAVTRAMQRQRAAHRRK